MHVTADGDKRMKELLKNEGWENVKAAAPDESEMAKEFHNKLVGFMETCYEWRRVRRKSTDKPWISDGMVFGRW